MTHRLSRRDLLRRGGVALGALGAPGLLGACASADTGAGSAASPTSREPTAPGPTVAGGDEFAGQEITLLVYSGLTEELYRQHFVPQFEVATGARAIIDSAWTEGIARLEAAPDDAPPFQLVLTDPTQGLPAIQQGLFQQFDTAAITNAGNFHPKLLDATVWNEGFGLPFHSSAMTLAWNTELNPDGFSRWGELLETAPAGGLMLYTLPYMSLYTFAEMLADAEGLPPGSGRGLFDEELDRVLAFAAEQAGQVDFFWPDTSTAVQTLIGGDAGAGNLHGNGLLAPQRDGEPVAGTIPEGTDAYVQLFFAIPQGVDNLELSLAALNHIASREFQQALASSGEYSCAVPDIAAEYAETDEAWAAAFPHTAAEFESFAYYPYDTYAANQQRIEETWDTEILRSA